MGKTRDFFKKMRYTKGTFHAKMGTIKDRNGMDLTEAEHIKKRWQEYTEELSKKGTAAAAVAKLRQLCPTLSDPMDCSLPGSPVPGILQARVLGAIAFSDAWKLKVKGKSLSRVQLLATPWTAAYQAPPSMGFSRQEYWRGCHCLLRKKALMTQITTMVWSLT